MLGTLYGVGVGPGPMKYLTLQAAEVLRMVDIVFTVTGPKSKSSISRSIVEELGGISGEIHDLQFSMSRDAKARHIAVVSNALIIKEQLLKGKSCAFATIGDPMIYSTFGYIMKYFEKHLPLLHIKVVPGITSFAALAARSKSILVEDTEELRIVPGFDKASAEEFDFQPGTTTALMKLYRNREIILDRIGDDKDYDILYGARLGLKEEKMSRNMDEVRELPSEYLSMLVVKR